MEYTKIVKVYKVAIPFKSVLSTDGLPVEWSYFIEKRDDGSYGIKFNREGFDPLVDEVYVEVYPEYKHMQNPYCSWKDMVGSTVLKTNSIETENVSFSFGKRNYKNYTINGRVKLVFTAYIPVEKKVPILSGFELSEKNTAHDKVLIVEEKKFYVNKSVLSLYSSFFDNLFNNENFDESKKYEIELKELDAKEFEILLQVIYPTNVTVDADNVVFLWKLADRFDITSVAKMCEDFLCNLEGTDAKKFKRANLNGIKLDMEYTKVVKEYVLALTNKRVQKTDDFPLSWSFSVTQHSGGDYGLKLKQQLNYYVQTDHFYLDILPEYKYNKSRNLHWKDSVRSMTLNRSCKDIQLIWLSIVNIKKWSFNNRFKLVCTAYVPVEKKIPAFVGFDVTEKNTAHDKVLIVGGKKFYINKAVLSLYSSFFDNLLNNENFEESKQYEIELKELNAKEFEVLLQFIYPSNATLNSE